MRAVVMAGGEGQRLRPLTCDLPKPMVPFFDRPVMAYQIDLLRQHGFGEIAVTTAYLPNAITEYFGNGHAFGVDMQYANEEKPLGTAGSVKHTGRFIDEPFLVISGDAITDIDLSAAVRFHKKRDAQVTIILKRVEIPLEYGVVVTNQEGRIVRFLEKPDWGEVFSDTVNTGIYIIEPEIMQHVPQGKPYDFAQQLFPQQLAAKARMYGYVADEYWCDIGDMQQYMQAHIDALDGKVRLDLGKQVAPGVFTRGGQMPMGCNIAAPAYVGAKARIGEDVSLGAYAVLGQGTRVGDGCSLRRSIVWQGSSIGRGAELRGSIVCENAKVGRNTRLFEGSVVGSDTTVGDGTTITPNRLVWPGKSITQGLTISEDIVWGDGGSAYAGNALQDISVSRAAGIGSALARMTRGGVAVACVKHPAAASLRLALTSGLCGAGTDAVDMGYASLPAMRWMMKQQNLEAGVYVEYYDGLCELRFFDEDEFSRSKMRTLTSQVSRLDRTSEPDDAHYARAYPMAQTKYVQHLAQKFPGGDKQIICFGPGGEELAAALLRCGNKPYCVRLENTAARIRIPGRYAMGVWAGADGEQFHLYDELGHEVSERELWALKTYACAYYPDAIQAYLPANAPVGLREFAQRHEASLATRGDLDVYHSAAGFTAALSLALSIRKHSIHDALAELPAAADKQMSLSIEPNKIAVVMRTLSGAEQAQAAGRGITIQTEDGFAEVFPDITLPGIIIAGSAYSAEVADELTGNLAELAQRAMQQDN